LGERVGRWGSSRCGWAAAVWRSNCWCGQTALCRWIWHCSEHWGSCSR